MKTGFLLYWYENTGDYYGMSTSDPVVTTTPIAVFQSEEILNNFLFRLKRVVIRANELENQGDDFNKYDYLRNWLKLRFSITTAVSWSDIVSAANIDESISYYLRNQPIPLVLTD